MESESKTGLHTGLGILSLVVGIMALLFSFLPCIGSLAIYVAIVGLISGIAGYVTAKQSNQDSGLSLGGTFISGAATIIALWQAHNVSTATSALENFGQTANNLIKGYGQNQTSQPAPTPPTATMHVSDDVIVVICILVFCTFIFFLYKAISGKQKDKTNVAENDMAKPSVANRSSFILRDILILLGIFVLGGALFSGYWFFFRHDPTSDAKTVVRMLCDCNTASSERRLRRYKEFVASFDKYQFKRQSEGREKLQFIFMSDDTLQDCLLREKNVWQTLRTNYISDPEKQKQFDLVFAQLSNTCGDPYNLQYTEVEKEAEKKFATLKDPEPAETQIKNNLIGRKTLGWNFDFLSEFKEFHIDSVSRNGNRLEYEIRLLLQDGRNNLYQREKVIVTYEKEEKGWYLLDVKALTISYVYRAMVNQWQRVGLLRNCTFTIDGHGQRFWIRDGLYGQQQIGGPDAAEPLQITGNEVGFMSREDHEIDIDFIYYPKQ